jgi:hypothetical protein
MTAEQQMAPLKSWGARTIFVDGEEDDFVAALRPGNEGGVVALHRLGSDWDKAAERYQQIEARGATLINIETDKPFTVADMMAAKKWYRGERRMPNSEEAKRRALLSKRARRKLLNGHKVKAREIWRNLRIKTNDAACAKIEKLIGVEVSLATLWRAFGPSGRPRGNPNRKQ